MAKGIFKNTGSAQKIQVGKDSTGLSRWKTVQQGESIELERTYAEKLPGFEEVADKKHAAKQKEAERESKQKKSAEDKVLSYEEELFSVKGLGKKAQDGVLAIYPSRDELLAALKSGSDLPLPVAVVKKLNDHFLAEQNEEDREGKE